LNYQGYLSDSEGAGITDSLSMVFTIFDEETGGFDLWSESFEVGILDGAFNVQLGEVTPLEAGMFSAEPDLWIEVSVEGETLSPRTRVTSVPYAFSAVYADTAEFSYTGDDGDWTISGSDVYSSVSGNVGIGTPSPFRKLHVLSSLSGGGILTESPSSPTLYLSNSSIPQLWAMFVEDYTGKLIFSDDPDQRMVIDSDGDVGIGSLNPTSRLQVKGVIPTGNDNLVHFISEDDGTDDVRTMLALRRNSTMGSDSGFGAGIDAFLDNAISGSMHWVARGSVGGDTDLRFNLRYDNGLHTRMLFQGDGRVGVGTDFNLYKFTMKKSSDDFFGGFAIQGWDGNNYAVLNTDANENFNIWTYDIPTGWHQRLTVNHENGNVGVGETDPQSSLHVNDLLLLEPTDAPFSPLEGQMYMDSTDHVLKVYDGTQWRSCW
jgi:hypothetical protein